MATALNLPAEQDLEADAAVNAADAAELEQVEDAAAAVEEGDEVLEVGEGKEQVIGEDDGQGTGEGEEHVESTETTEAVEEVPEAAELAAADESSPAMKPAEPSESPGPQLAATPNAPPAHPSSAIATRSPARPPQPTAMATFEFNRANAVDEYIGATLECQKLEEAYKRAKKRMEAARDKLVEIESDRPDEDEWDSEYVVEEGPVVGPARVVGPAPPTAPVEVVDCSTTLAQEAPPTPDVDPNAWRNTQIFALMLPSPITGKLIEEGYNTLGKLEDLRADTYAGGLKAIKGIGQKKADLIEDAILNWLSKNRDQAVLAAAAGEKAADAAVTHLEVADEADEADEAAVAPTEAAEEGTAEPEAASDDVGNASADNAAANNASDASATSDDGNSRWFANIEERAREIMALGDNCLNEQLDPDEAGGGWWSAGYEQFNAGVNLIECPVVPGPERDDWIRGWMSAKILHDGGWDDAESATQETQEAIGDAEGGKGGAA